MKAYRLMSKALHEYMFFLSFAYTLYILYITAKYGEPAGRILSCLVFGGMVYMNLRLALSGLWIQKRLCKVDGFMSMFLLIYNIISLINKRVNSYTPLLLLIEGMLLTILSFSFTFLLKSIDCKNQNKP